MALVDVLNKHSRNGVLLLEDVKSANYPLYKYCIQNIDSIKVALSDCGTCLITKSTKLDYDKAKFLLLYYYGDIINTSTLYRKHKTIYNYLSSLDNRVPDTLKEMGFNTTNNRNLGLIRKLKNMSRNGHISNMDKNTYNKVYHQANRNGITVREYLQGHGLTYTLNGHRDKEILEMRKKGFSLNKIAKNTNTSKATVCRVLKKGNDGNGK